MTVSTRVERWPSSARGFDVVYALAHAGRGTTLRSQPEDEVEEAVIEATCAVLGIDRAALGV